MTTRCIASARLLAFAACCLSTLLAAPGTARADVKLEVYAETELAGGNLTITPEGRKIMSLHPFYGPKWRVVEVGDGGTLTPFPNEKMNLGPQANGDLFIDGVLGLQSDRNGVVWMLDAGARNGSTPKLVAWDTRGNKLHRVIELPAPVTNKASFLNDLAIDHASSTIYITDTALGGEPALIVLDLKSGKARRVLENHTSVVPEDLPFKVDGTAIAFGEDKVNPRVGVNPIAIGPKEEWLYFAPMSGRSLYKVRTADLRDESLSADQLAKRVSRHGPKPISDGSTADTAGNVYISGVEDGSVGIVTPQGDYKVLVTDAKALPWPDDFAFGNDGWLYIVANQLHLSAQMAGGTDKSKPPYAILRMKPQAPGQAGR